MSFPLRRLLPLAALVPAALYAVTGCGEKIAIPEPKGLFSVSAYGLYEGVLGSWYSHEAVADLCQETCPGEIIVTPSFDAAKLTEMG